MIKKQTNELFTRRLFAGALLMGVVAAPSLRAQIQSRPPGFSVPKPDFRPNPYTLPPLPVSTAAIPNGTVVEEVVARINDQIITRSEYEAALQDFQAQAQRQNMPVADYQEKVKDTLRDMIDEQLLVSKAKALGITGDAETMRQLDEIRKQNHLDSMEALEKAAQQSGVSFEDFKQQIRNRVLTQQVIRDEIGRRVPMSRADEAAYYNAHAKEFEAPEQLHLSEILVPTPENPTDAQISEAQGKADDLETKLKGGANFAELAKSSSGGPTAAAGGDLGDFKRGVLGDVLEKATFSLAAGSYTQPIRTRQGFVILRVDKHQDAGVPPLADVEPQVQQALYMAGLEPAMRKYLTTARDEAFYEVKAGYIDTGAATANSTPLFTAYAPPPLKKKVIKHQEAEQKRAEKAQEALVAARAKAAQKAEAKSNAQAAKNGGVQKVSEKAQKPAKVHPEKIRYGQAPRNALPPSLTQQAGETAPPLAGQAPGAVMAPMEATTTLSIGTGVDPDNPLAPKAEPTHKTRLSDRQHEHEEQIATANLAKAEAKASARPLKATEQETADEKARANPLGLNGDTTKKQKVKRKKGDPKERLQEKTKPVETPIAPTVNPALGGSPITSAPANTPQTTKPSADKTTLPPPDTPAPGAMPAGQPIPATTGTQPNAPATTPIQH